MLHLIMLCQMAGHSQWMLQVMGLAALNINININIGIAYGSRETPLCPSSCSLQCDMDNWDHIC